MLRAYFLEIYVTEIELECFTISGSNTLVKNLSYVVIGHRSINFHLEALLLHSQLIL